MWSLGPTEATDNRSSVMDIPDVTVCCGRAENKVGGGQGQGLKGGEGKETVWCWVVLMQVRVLAGVQEGLPAEG